MHEDFAACYGTNDGRNQSWSSHDEALPLECHNKENFTPAFNCLFLSLSPPPSILISGVA
jgi:hypothetical protein